MLDEAKEFLADGLNKRAVDNCEQALSALAVAVKASGLDALSCLWKLMGQVCTVLHDLPEELAALVVPAEVLPTLQAGTKATKLQLYQLGAKCFVRAVQIDPDNPSLWHDLAMNHYYHSREGHDVHDLLRKSEAAARKALSLDPTCHTHWNALGLIGAAGERWSLAQHAFIKSIVAENNAPAWTNLGIVYLMLG